MKQSTCLCLLLCLLCSVAPAQESRSASIAAYVGRDVRKMDADEKQAFIDLFRSMTQNDKALRREDWEFVPQTLYAFSDPALRFFVEIAPGFERPGFCGLRIHTFDNDWKFVRQDAFSTGYRQEITDVYATKAKALSAEVLVVKTIYAGSREVTRDGKKIETPFQLQFYAVVDGSLMLVRREDDQGRLVLNRYANWSVPEIGMNHPQGTTEELLDILRSQAVPRKLALLAWVAGRHMSSAMERVDGVSQEPIESSRAYEALIHTPAFAETMRVLRRSENKWIREYVAHIPFAEQPDEREQR